MKKSLGVAGVVLTCVAFAWGYTKMNSVWLINSKIDSSAITSSTMATSTINGGTLANATITSGTSNSTTFNSPAIVGGTMSGTAISNGTMGGTAISAGSITNETITNGTIAGAIITGGTVSSTFTGPLAGNATTATSLASTPTNCGVTGTSYGITANGSAICNATAVPRTCNAYGCYRVGVDGTLEEWGNITSILANTEDHYTIPFSLSGYTNCVFTGVTAQAAGTSGGLSVWQYTSTQISVYASNNDPLAYFRIIC